MSRTVLVTGAAGFIGSALSIALLERGDRVIGLDNFNDYYSPARKRENIGTIQKVAGDFHLIEGDIRDRELVDRIFRTHPLTAVAHLAAMAGVRSSVEEPWLYYDVNLTGTLNLLDAARREGNPLFVFASTSSVYGRTEHIPFIETDNADRPLAPYPASKRAAELLGHTYHHVHGIDFTALRFFTVYGERGRPDMMAYLVLESMRSGQPLPLYEGGQMVRDFTYVGDIVPGVLAALDRRLGYEIINLGRGAPVVLSDFVRELTELSGREAHLVRQPMLPADVSYTYASIDKARRLLGYSPNVSVEEGLRRFYAWYVDAIGPL